MYIRFSHKCKSVTLGARGFFFRSEAEIGRITIAASPLTIAASLRKKNPLAPRVQFCWLRH